MDKLETKANSYTIIFFGGLDNFFKIYSQLNSKLMNI